MRRPLSLKVEAEAAASRGQPLVLLVSLPGCPYCEAVRKAYLLPLAREHPGVVQIDLTSAAPLDDVDGRPSTHDQVARRLRARLAPTVIFVNGRGDDVAERLVGGGNDFYGALLDQRLDTARAALSRP